MRTLIYYFLISCLSIGSAISLQASQADWASYTNGNILTVICHSNTSTPQNVMTAFDSSVATDLLSAHYALHWTTPVLPDSQLQKVLETLDRAIDDMLYLGIVARECSTGIVLEQIMYESPAHKAALPQGSLVISVNGKEISTLENLKEALAEARDQIRINWQDPLSHSGEQTENTGSQFHVRQRMPYDAIAEQEKELWYEAMKSETTLLESGTDSVSGVFRLKAELTDMRGGSIRLVNEAGATAWTGIIPAWEPVYHYDIDLQLLPRGIYSVIIEQESGVSSHKVLIH